MVQFSLQMVYTFIEITFSLGHIKLSNNIHPWERQQLSKALLL